MDVEDSEGADLLRRLPAATTFISNALQRDGGRVLVHCAQGVSRSAAVVVAYLLSAVPELDVSGALGRVRAAAPSASPNPGFLRQLELWAAMGCRLAEGHLPYKRWLLEQAGREYEESGTIDTAALAAPAEPGADGGEGAALYRCRKCRALVATAHNLVEAEEGPGAQAFPWRKRDKVQRAAASSGALAGSAGAEEGSLFVEPLCWMADIVGGPVQGKLYCPK